MTDAVLVGDHLFPPLADQRARSAPPRVFRVPELNYDPMTSICDALNDTGPAD